MNKRSRETQLEKTLEERKDEEKKNSIVHLNFFVKFILTIYLFQPRKPQE